MNRRKAFTVSLAAVMVIVSGCSVRRFRIGPGARRSALTEPRVATGRIAFTSSRMFGRANIYVVGTDGTGLRRLTFNPFFEDCPAWAPGGHTLAFNRGIGLDAGTDIYLIDADGRNERRLTTDMQAGAPTWSADGQRLAFHAGTGAERDIHTIAVDGTNMQKLTATAGEDAYPAFSADGRFIAFHTTRHNTTKSGRPDEWNWELYLMTADGIANKRLTEHPAADKFPAWSHDGQRIAFLSNRTGDWEVFVMDNDGAQVRQVTQESGRMRRAMGRISWSPDDRYIAYAALPEKNGDLEILIMRISGAGRQPLTSIFGDDFNPAWQPAQ